MGFIIAKVLCPVSANGRLYPSSLIKRLVERGAFNDLPVIDGHTGSGPATKVGRIVKAVYDADSRCAIALIELNDEKYLELAKKGMVRFSIEGIATSVERIGGDLIVKDLKLEGVAIVAEPGVASAKPLAVIDDKREAVAVIESLVQMNLGEGMSEKAPYVGYVKPEAEEVKVEEQDSLNAPSYAGPVYVNVNVNVTGREQTESKVQSQKGEEEEEERPEATNERPSGAKFQVQRGRVERMADELEEKKKKKTKEEVEEECIDEACKKRKKAKEEAEAEEACGKRAKEEEGAEEEEELPADLLEKAKKDALKKMVRKMALKTILAEMEEELGEEVSDEDLEFVEGILELAGTLEPLEESENKDEELVKKCQELSKKYGIPCVLGDKVAKPRHPECIGNPKCCDPVNGFWPIDRPGRARIAVYLMTRHWVRMARRYGLKGWAKVVDCIVKRAKEYGVDVKCSTLKERSPNIWPYLTVAKKLCKPDTEGLIPVGEAMVSVKEASVAGIATQADPDTALLKLMESLRTGTFVAEEIQGDSALLVPIVSKINEFTREGKLWGKLGHKLAVAKERLIVGAPIEVPVIDYRFDTAEVIDTYPPTAPTVETATMNTVTVTIKKAQGAFWWSDDEARLIRNIGSFATRYLGQTILNTLDKAVADVLANKSTPLNYDPNDVYNTVNEPNVGDILDAETYLATEGYNPSVAVVSPIILSKLAQLDPEIKQALAYAKRIEPGQVIELLGLKVIVGDKLVTPVEEVTYTDPSTGNTSTIKVAYMYMLDERAVVEVDDGTVELAPAYYPEKDKPYVLVARKYFGVEGIKNDAIVKLAFKVG